MSRNDTDNIYEQLLFALVWRNQNSVGVKSSGNTHGGKMSEATASKIGRILIVLGLINLILIFAYEAFSKEVQVIDIRKNIKLTNDDKEYTDYYLNAGEDIGIKPGTIFTLFRRISVIDRLGTNQGRPLALPVGKIKIIYVSRDLSVARVEKLEKNDNSPLLDFRGVMLGDLINTDSAQMSKRKEKYGPQGLEVSFQPKPISIPDKSNTDAEEDERMPTAVPEQKGTFLELKADPPAPTLKVDKAGVAVSVKPGEKSIQAPVQQ